MGHLEFAKIFEMLKNKELDIVINIPSTNKIREGKQQNTSGYQLRRGCIDFDIPLFTDIKTAKLFVETVTNHLDASLGVREDIDCKVSYQSVRLPAIVDMHTHVRDFGQSYKEDWETCSKAAIAGGITTICAMPNTVPALINSKKVSEYDSVAKDKSYCNYYEIKCNTTYKWKFYFTI